VPDDAVVDRPPTRLGVPVDAGALDAQDELIPRNHSTAGLFQVLWSISSSILKKIGAEFLPRLRCAAAELPGRLPRRRRARGVIRRGPRPTGLAVLEIADDVQTCGTQRVRVLAGDGLCLEVRAGTRLGHVIHYPVISRGFDFVGRDPALAKSISRRLAAEARGASRVAAAVPRPSRTGVNAYLRTSRREADRRGPLPRGPAESCTARW